MQCSKVTLSEISLIDDDYEAMQMLPKDNTAVSKGCVNIYRSSFGPQNILCMKASIKTTFPTWRSPTLFLGDHDHVYSQNSSGTT